MRSERVVIVDVALDRFAQFTWAAVFVDVNQFRLETAEPALNHDIVRPTGFAIHALTDVKLFEQLFVFLTGELATLI